MPLRLEDTKLEETFRFVNVKPVPPLDNDAKLNFAVHQIRQLALAKEADRIIHESPVTDIDKARAQRVRLAEIAKNFLSKNSITPIEQTTSSIVTAVVNAIGTRTTTDPNLGIPEGIHRSLPALKDNLWSRLYAYILAPEEKIEERALVSNGIRAIHFIEWLKSQPAECSAISIPLSSLESIHITIPENLIPSVSSTILNSATEVKRQDLLGKLKPIVEQIENIDAAIIEIKRVDRIMLARPAEVRVTTSSQPWLSSISFNLFRAPAVTVNTTRMEILEKKPWIFEKAGEDALTAPILTFLKTKQLTLQGLSAPRTITALEKDKYDLVTHYLSTLSKTDISLIKTTSEYAKLFRLVTVPNFLYPPITADDVRRINDALHPNVHVLGIGDLFVVKQELLRYEPGELAHVENVMGREKHLRKHTQTRETERIVTTETEMQEETKKDLETAERFEMQKEAKRTADQQMKLEAGLSVTGSYGFVSMTAHADFALNQASSDSTRAATTFARQVTEKSVSNIQQRTKATTSVRTLERVTEENEHGFDNTTAPEHVTGMYRYVNKLYKTRVINYGKRLMLEFIVPEPAAFYRYMSTQQSTPNVSAKEPVAPTVIDTTGHKIPLTPQHLDRNNYMTFVAQYQVQDVEACPAEEVNISAAFAETVNPSADVSYAKSSEKLIVPNGYICYGLFGWKSSAAFGTNHWSQVFLAGHPWDGQDWSPITGIIPISINGWGSCFNISITVNCRLTEAALTAWQLKTFQAIMTAYNNRLSEYKDQVAAAKIQAGVDIQGRNPDINRKIEQDELKKGAIRLLTDGFSYTRVAGVARYDEAFNAMRESTLYPEFDIQEAFLEGKIVQFFEQALEWRNMAYRFYSYQWGRQANWPAVFRLSDPDPKFMDFLHAGSARVVIPVSREYNKAIFYYLVTREIWNGSDAPTLHSPLYMALVDELKADDQAELQGDLARATPENPKPKLPYIVEEWETKVPTSLIWLQPKPGLPNIALEHAATPAP